MSVNLSVKNVSEALATKLRDRAARNHRSLQGELMAILEDAAMERQALKAASGAAPHEVAREAPASASLLDRLVTIAGERGIDASRRLSREQVHDRARLRKANR
jgi:plasmid stability protein